MVRNDDRLLPLRHQRLRLGRSERELANAAGISRGALRSVESGSNNVRLNTLSAAASALEMRIQVIGFGETGAPECSTVAISMKVCVDGFTSWKQHFMELVDEFRRTLDTRLILLPPVAQLDRRLEALLASIVFELCREAGIDTPGWALSEYFLSDPWFVSETESLKASALIESPIAFRRNNIFVLENFLDRV